jgi:predicted amidophosphoribosyltransferase
VGRHTVEKVLLDLLLPIRCAACGLPGHAFCLRCRDALIRLAPPLCDRCGSPGAWPVQRCAECSGRRVSFTTARAAIVYDATARRFVHAWKERGQRSLARDAAVIVTETLARPRAPVLSFVPSDRDRGLSRGHRPAEALARELGRVWELPVASLVRRTRTAERQRGLGLQERRRNARGAFAAARASPPGVCLVDDVYTSGATAGAAASALRRGGARRVEVVTLARAVR